jgi:cytochrome c
MAEKGNMMIRQAGMLSAVALAVIALTQSASAGDAKKGQQGFAICQTCHSVVKGGGNGIGPNLFGVAGRKAASLPGFYYSAALKSANITWTNDKLKAWIMAPARTVPGTRMTFAGISDPTKADDIVAYLDTLK